MRQNKPSISAAPAVYILFALAVVLLPLKLLLAWGLSVLTHEICHILAVVLCRGRVERIRFSLTGAQITAVGLTISREIICVLAGPIGSMLLLILFRWYPYLTVCAFIQAAFNLLPLTNLDGGKALQGILCLHLGENAVQKICTRIDRVTRWVLCLLSILAAWKLSWAALGVIGCIYFLPKKRIKYPCKPQAQRVQYR